jgi:short-subunit dehydrogenase
MGEWLHDIFRDRPWWMNAVMVFCAWMAFIYVPWDIFFKPAAVDQEVWFGFTFTGYWAKLMAWPHWFVYGAAVYGFRRWRPWMGFWSTAYTAQVTFGMFLWPILYYGSLLGFVLGAIAAIPFGLLTLAFWNTQDHFFVERGSLRDRYGDWALVTGASAGLGMEFARALARDGVSCVLTARREERLRKLASELQEQHGVATRVVAIDLAEPEAAERLAHAVSDLEIGVLVNNAGFGYAGRFDGLETSRLRDMIQVNCVAPVVLTSLILPGMRARRRGAVVITGSVAGRQPMPLHSVYSATKSFDLLFGEALWVELRDAGIDVLVLEPGSTQTEFQEVAGELAHPGESAERVVAVAFEALGRQPSVVSGWLNWLRANLATRIGSRPLVAYVARHVMEVQTPADRR